LKKKVDNSKKADGEIDPRFAEAMKNPIFRRVPKREKKIDIDKRFQSMFHVSSKDKCLSCSVLRWTLTVGP